MYRCKECQTEYEIKPDYCDCGNDTFDEILPKSVTPEPQKIKPSVEKPVQKPKEKSKLSINTKIDPYAYVIFILCVLMSFVVIFFIGNPRGNSQEETTPQISLEKNIPSIERFWDNTPIKISEPEQPEPPKTIIEKVIPKVVQPKPVQKQTVQTPVQKPVQTKPVQQQTNQKPTQKPVQTQTQSTQNKNIQLPKSVTDIANNKQTQQAATAPQKQTVTTPVVKKLDPQEYARYKNSLMSRIASKINFAGVIGNGSCTVSFSISSNGALINRKFEKQSENSTLNDAVYHAIMQTPSFNPPPEGYKGETIRMNIMMTNGTFEVNIN